MKISHFIVSIILMMTLVSFGKGNLTIVKGIVMDENKQPVEYAIVTLLQAKDSAFVRGTLTSAEGKFEFQDMKDGNYLVSCSLTGYIKQWAGPFTIPGEESVKFINLSLVPNSELSEVVITAKQPLFVQKPGMLVMNIENNTVRVSGTAYDVLSKAPGVSVDQDGNFFLKGKAGTQIYIDGKPTYLSGDQLQAYLMNMPASSIVKLEIMSTPPAKYNAEGSAGIINIVTKKENKQGFNGSMNGGFGQGNASRTEAGLNLNYGGPKFYLYSKYDFSTPVKKETKTVNRVVNYNGESSAFDQNVDLRFSSMSQHLKIGADFYPTKNIVVGVRSDMSSIKRNTSLDSRTKVSTSDSIHVLHQLNDLNGIFKNGSAGLFYKQTLDTSGSELSASVDYVNYQNKSLESYNLQFQDNGGNDIASPSLQRSSPNTSIGIYVGQIDFVHPFKKKYKIEAGIKSSYVNSSNNLLFEIQNTSNGLWSNDTSRTNSFIYKERIYAAYVNGTADFKKWQVQLGLRAEQTNSDGDSPTKNEHHRNNYLQLFPTIFLSQKINDAHSFQYTFSRRINRPGYDQLNPFYFYVDKYLYKIGNPYLQPEISNSADITHDFKETIFTSIGVSRTTQGIAHVTHLVDSTGIMNQYVVNMNTIDNAYVSVSYSKSLTKWWANDCNVIADYTHYNGNLSGTTLNKGNLGYNINITERFDLNKGWKVELSGYYQSGKVYSLFFIKPNASVGLGLSKTFFKDKLRVSLNASDIFYMQSQRVTIDFDNQHVYSVYNFDSRVVFLRLRYNFGTTGSSKKSQFKSASDDLQNRIVK